MGTKKDLMEEICRVIPYIDRLPEEQNTRPSIECRGYEPFVTLGIQAKSFTVADKIKALYPEAEWTRAWSDSCGWWSYIGYAEGIKITIYAIRGTHPEDSDFYDLTEERK